MIYKGPAADHADPVPFTGSHLADAEPFLAVRAAKRNEHYFTDPDSRRDYEAIDAVVAQRMIRFVRVRQVASAQAEKVAQIGAA